MSEEQESADEPQEAIDESGDSDASDDADDTADEPDAPPDEPQPVETADDANVADAGPRRPRWRWIAAAVLALGLIGAGYEGWLLFAHHQREVAAAQALEAAEKYTLTLTGVDPNAIDKNFTEVLDGATGEFKDLYAQSSEQLRQLLIDNKAAAHGTVIDAAVKSATKNKVEVLLFVDQSVSNKAAPQATIDRSRIVLTMEKVNGRWLAAKVDMP